MRKRVLLAVVAAAATGLMVAPLTASASSHREAPLIAEDPLADNTDLYAFVAPDDPNRTVIVANYVPFENPAGGPNFYRFGDDFANLGGVFDLLNFSGATTGAEDYLAGMNVHTIVLSVPSGMLTANGDPVIGVWSTASRNAITVLNGNGTKIESGNSVQVSRLGNPLVNEVVIGLNQKDLFNASSPSGDGQFLSRVTDPILATYLNAFFPGLGGGSAPEHNRNDLVSVFLTGIQGLNQPAHLTAPGEELRLNTSIPPSSQNPNAVNPLGVLGGQLDGFPNGRRLADDVVDIEVQAVLGILCQSGGPLAGPTPCRTGSVPDVGDGVRANDVPFQASFPYVADPHSP